MPPGPELLALVLTLLSVPGLRQQGLDGHPVLRVLDSQGALTTLTSEAQLQRS